MTSTPDTEPRVIPAFEVNLIGDRVNWLRRREAIQHVVSVMALGMLLVAGVLALAAATHLTSAMRRRVGVRLKEAELLQQRKVCDELDQMQAVVATELAGVSPLVRVASARIAWAPRLVAFANALPKGMGIAALSASSGDVLAASTGTQAPKAMTPEQKEAAVPRMTFSVVYAPRPGSSEDPTGFLERLQASEPFMRKMAFIRIEATEREVWRDTPVILLQGSCKGSAGNE